MCWTVRFEDGRLGHKLRIWNGRYPGLIALIQRRIAVELAADPDAHLGPPCVPTGTRPYYLELTPDGDGVSEPLHITFYVNRRDQTRELIVVEGLYRTDRFPRE